MDDAVEVLASAVRDEQSILILADFDADGATSCAVAVQGLRALGAAHVDFLVPNRFEFGYGLTPEIVGVAEQRSPQVLVTVDNGISSHEGVAAARAHGWRVVITDHHLPGATLPEADAIVNPTIQGDRFPGKALAGVGVIFYVLSALRSRLRADGWFQADRKEPNLAELLDYVALGTIADIVPLDHLNRILVHQGLQRIRSGRAHAGINALLEVAGKHRSALTAEDLGFAVAPRLNAAGRLEDMTIGIDCLLASDSATAMALAMRLDALNRERKEIEKQMKAEALVHVRAIDGMTAAEKTGGLCLFDETWHPGVIGLVASRIKDRFHRPVVAFAGAPNGELKGSARSIPGLHIRDLLSDLSARTPQLIARFGGHAMAAGLSIRHEDFARFAELFTALVDERLTGTEDGHVLHTDGTLETDRMDLATAECLRMAGPWGQAFPEPLFDGQFEVMDRSVAAGQHLKMALRPEDSSQRIDGIAFFLDAPLQWTDVKRIRAAYRLDVNEFRGNRAVQLKIEYMESLDSAPVSGNGAGGPE
jgi:single-stranded-DNA-specific exonuclease